jgi:hypothetical protein
VERRLQEHLGHRPTMLTSVVKVPLRLVSKRRSRSDGPGRRANREDEPQEGTPQITAPRTL